MPTVSFDEVVGPLLAERTPELDRFAEAVQVDIQADYDRTFGVGEAVARRRAELGLSQAELARRSGIPKADISRLERGRSNPTLATLRKVLDVLQLNLQVLPAA